MCFPTCEEVILQCALYICSLPDWCQSGEPVNLDPVDVFVDKSLGLAARDPGAIWVVRICHERRVKLQVLKHIIVVFKWSPMTLS